MIVIIVAILKLYFEHSLSRGRETPGSQRCKQHYHGVPIVPQGVTQVNTAHSVSLHPS